MSFTKTLFSTTSSSNNRTAVYNFLKTNAAEFYDSIENSNTMGSVKLVKNSVTVLQLQFTGSSSWPLQTWELINGGSLAEKSTCYWTTSNAWAAGFVSSNGIFLQNANANLSLFITKSTSDSIILAGKRCLSDSADCSAYGVALADVENDVSITSQYTDAGVENTVFSPVAIAGKTSITPAVTSSGSYSENLFVTPFAQYPTNGTIFIMDGTEYVTDGWFALKS